MEQTATLLSLMTFPDIDPVILAIGPVEVRWYGLAYVLGIILGWRYARRLVENRKLWPASGPRMSAPDMDDFLLWATVGIVAGGRIGYILFYDFAAVAADPLRALEIWNGGMSFHGGLLGTLVAMILFARSRNIPVFNLFDVVCAVVPVGLFFGRLANFINAELWGKLTDVPWAFVFPTGGPFPRHPTQLYEAALEGLLLLAVLAWLIYRRQAFQYRGLISGCFVAGYALSRIFVEFFREPDAHIGYLAGGWLTMGMVLSLPMLAVGLWVMSTARRRD
ncbi:prolipoprotein diacylglyceryl transferase [Hoeflea halophila]|uniref:Phosphatidylglycerol--prolipoprotein diacylglyceryl transferase n=1 Tax=Hoeflea halophila TaxID=714899 RepID=A0A286I260_9HYPH|nr:prolipoprotein diacylglyceryl transferase [Hoeflea halophila]SOE14195.1 prolipoprotein diacylglyceryl transferase [Hoeflea halophila]